MSWLGIGSGSGRTSRRLMSWLGIGGGSGRTSRRLMSWLGIGGGSGNVSRRLTWKRRQYRPCLRTVLGPIWRHGAAIDQGQMRPIFGWAPRLDVIRPPFAHHLLRRVLVSLAQCLIREAWVQLLLSQQVRLGDATDAQTAFPFKDRHHHILVPFAWPGVLGARTKSCPHSVLVHLIIIATGIQSEEFCVQKPE